MQKGMYYLEMMDRISEDHLHENFSMLSILIPSIPDRSVQLKELIKELEKQIREVRDLHPVLGKVQVIIDDSKKFLDGGLSIGKKRQSLVDKSNGKYICFLDDDESIAPNYVETILRLCLQDKDVCCFRNISKLDTYWCIVDMSIRNNNEQATDSYIVKRKPWHICPVRRGLTAGIEFPDSNYGEDWVWFSRVLANCKTEAKTKAVIHQYNHSINKSEANKAHEKSGS